MFQPDLPADDITLCLLTVQTNDVSDTQKVTHVARSTVAPCYSQSYLISAVRCVFVHHSITSFPAKQHEYLYLKIMRCARQP